MFFFAGVFYSMPTTATKELGTSALVRFPIIKLSTYQQLWLNFVEQVTIDVLWYHSIEISILNVRQMGRRILHEKHFQKR